MYVNVIHSTESLELHRLYCKGSRLDMTASQLYPHACLNKIDLKATLPRNLPSSR